MPATWSAVLEQWVGDLCRRAGLDIRVEAPHAALDVPEPHRTLACRVVHELCLNALKHAHARRVQIVSELADGRLRVQVRDDGVGLSAAPPARWRAGPAGGFGLASAQAQVEAAGGELHLSSERGGGTCARFVLPLATTA
jgi:signal transduction histidine kinase